MQTLLSFSFSGFVVFLPVLLFPPGYVESVGGVAWTTAFKGFIWDTFCSPQTLSLPSSPSLLSWCISPMTLNMDNLREEACCCNCVWWVAFCWLFTGEIPNFDRSTLSPLAFIWEDKIRLCSPFLICNERSNRWFRICIFRYSFSNWVSFALLRSNSLCEAVIFEAPTCVFFVKFCRRAGVVEMLLVLVLLVVVVWLVCLELDCILPGGTENMVASLGNNLGGVPGRASFFDPQSGNNVASVGWAEPLVLVLAGSTGAVNVVAAGLFFRSGFLFLASNGLLDIRGFLVSFIERLRTRWCLVSEMLGAPVFKLDINDLEGVETRPFFLPFLRLRLRSRSARVAAFVSSAVASVVGGVDINRTTSEGDQSSSPILSLVFGSPRSRCSGIPSIPHTRSLSSGRRTLGSASIHDPHPAFCPLRSHLPGESRDRTTVL